MYIWASITKSMKNYGNAIIEHCLRSVLRLPEPDLVLDLINEPYPHNLDLRPYQFIVSPGSTTLYPDSILFSKAGVGCPPIFCFGGSIMDSGGDADKMLAVSCKIQSPIGSRDPFTHDLLTQHGMSSELIGCPTLFPQMSSKVCNYVAFSFGHQNIPEQIMLLRSLARDNSVIVPIHETQEAIYCQKAGVRWVRGIDEMLAVYYGAQYVVTGRLHGALPSIAAGKPLLFFQGERHYDSRLTLLNYLGVKIHTVKEIMKHGTATVQVEYNADKVIALRCAFEKYVQRFKEDFGL